MGKMLFFSFFYYSKSFCGCNLVLKTLYMSFYVSYLSIWQFFYFNISSILYNRLKINTCGSNSQLLFFLKILETFFKGLSTTYPHYQYIHDTGCHNFTDK